MVDLPPKKRFIVSDVGHGYAVHDTEVPYQRLEGDERGDLPPSSNAFTSRIVETCSSRRVAQRIADELNLRYDRSAR